MTGTLFVLLCKRGLVRTWVTCGSMYVRFDPRLGADAASATDVPTVTFWRADTYRSADACFLMRTACATTMDRRVMVRENRYVRSERGDVLMPLLKVPAIVDL